MINVMTDFDIVNFPFLDGDVLLIAYTFHNLLGLLELKPASNFILLIVPKRYFCCGSYCFMSWCLYFCAAGGLCMLSYVS